MQIIHEINDEVIHIMNDEKYRVVGDKNTPYVDAFGVKHFVEEGLDYILVSLTPSDSPIKPIQVPSRFLKPIQSPRNA